MNEGHIHKTVTFLGQVNHKVKDLAPAGVIVSDNGHKVFDYAKSGFWQCIEFLHHTGSFQVFLVYN
jgi:hypothetical protein